MIPRIAKRGQSFKGAGMYYLHDKDALTAQRVAWAYTLNLPTDDPQKAMKCMAYTAIHADELKRASGVSRAGRQSTAGSVYSYSLSWHGEQSPDRAAMLSAATQTLERLGLAQHQALIVAHSDTDHPHAHVIVNLVHPQTGKTANVRQDQRTLSEWASEYEHAQGKVYCEKREENATRRQRGEITKHQDERVPDAPSLTDIYRRCDTGKAFADALQEAGYTLAQGDKGRLCIVDSEGKIQNLVRQIDGAKKKDIEAKLSDIDLTALPNAEAQAARRTLPLKNMTEKRSIVSHVVEVVNLPAKPQEDTKPESVSSVQEAVLPLEPKEPAAICLQHAKQHQERIKRAQAEESLALKACPRPKDTPIQDNLFQRAVAHLYRFIRFIQEKPLEYIGRWLRGSRRRRNLREHEPENTAQSSREEKGHCSKIRRERDQEMQR